jgi:hypothetical protein
MTKKLAFGVSSMLSLIHQVSHKRSPGSSGRGKKFLIEPEAKSNESQDLHSERVGVKDREREI